MTIPLLNATSVSLESQRLDWIQVGRTSRRVVAKEHADGCRATEREGDRVRRHPRGPLERIRDSSRSEGSQCDSDRSADQAEKHRFDQELTEYVTATWP